MTALTRFTRILPDEQQTLLLKAALAPLPEAFSAWEQWKSNQSEILAGDPRGLLARFKNNLDPCSHRLLPLVYQNLKSSGDLVIPLLTPAYNRTAKHNRQVLGLIKSIVQTLEQHGFEVILLKGASLVHHYYEDPGVRRSADVDILVPPGQFTGVCRILEKELQYKPQVRPGSIFFRGMLRVMHSQVFRGELPVELDVHHRLFHEHVPDSRTGSFFEDKIRVSLPGDFEADILSPTHLLFHVLAHAREPKPAIRWVADAVTICRKAPDIRWEELLALSEAYRFTSFFKTMLPFLKEHFAVPVPEDILARLATTPVHPLEARYFRVQETIPGHAGGKLHQFFYRDWLRQQLYQDGPFSLFKFILQQRDRILYRVWERFS